MMRAIAVIQARMSSSRLPGKVLMSIAGRPMLSHVIERVRKSTFFGDIIIATSENPIDDAIETYCRQSGVQCFRGSEVDVLDRFYKAAQFAQADIIGRFTADCPLLDANVINRVGEQFALGSFDYVSNTLEPTYPDGLDTEIFTFTAISMAWKNADLPSEREHVTPYIYKHPEMFRLGSVKQAVDQSRLRWTVDEARDLDFVSDLYKFAGERELDLASILDLIGRHPNIGKINAGIMRNEGYQKSLREDSHWRKEIDGE